MNIACSFFLRHIFHNRSFVIPTPLKFNSSPLKRNPDPKRKYSSSPIIFFYGKPLISHKVSIVVSNKKSMILPNHTASWWLNQHIWKICASQIWIISPNNPNRDEKWKMFETTMQNTTTYPSSPSFAPLEARFRAEASQAWSKPPEIERTSGKKNGNMLFSSWWLNHL